MENRINYLLNARRGVNHHGVMAQSGLCCHLTRGQMKAFFIPVCTIDRLVRPKIRTEVTGRDDRSQKSG